jgi:hypothetical protein
MSLLFGITFASFTTGKKNALQKLPASLVWVDRGAAFGFIIDWVLRGREERRMVSIAFTPISCLEKMTKRNCAHDQDASRGPASSFLEN